MHWYPRYVPVDAQRARVVSEMNRLVASGVQVRPVELRGRTLASSFWGRRWCEHVESFSEYAARLAHGRACLRNGSVCHLSMEPGGVDAMVIGSALHHVTIRVRRLETAAWMAMRTACAGRVGSLIELRAGRVPDDVAEMVTDRGSGLFPQPGDIVASCDCGDTTALCKHAAAVLWGIGSRLDERPESLFLLRGVDETEVDCHRSCPLTRPGGDRWSRIGRDTGRGRVEVGRLDVAERAPTCEVDRVTLGPATGRLGRAIPPGQEDAHLPTAGPRPTPAGAARRAGSPARPTDSYPQGPWWPTCASGAGARWPSSRI